MSLNQLLLRFWVSEAGARLRNRLRRRAIAAARRRHPWLASMGNPQEMGPEHTDAETFYGDHEPDVGGGGHSE